MSKRNSYTYLLKNIGLLTFSSFATKLLSFFLVPLYTYILTTAEYGTYDIFHATVGILVPILTLNIHESVLRFSLDKDYDKNAIVTIAVKLLLLSSAIVGLGLLGNYIFGFSDIVKEYAIFFFLMFFSQALSGIVLAYIRGIDRITELSISSIIASVVTISCNIVFLVYFKWGLVGYFLANIIGPMMQSIYLLIRAKVPRNIKLRSSFKTERKEMTKYSAPMIANTIAWWVNSVSDRYVIIAFCGLAQNGVYSVASKIPSILNIFQTIFNQAWVLSAVKDYDSEDEKGFFSNTYKVYNGFLVILCSLLILTDKILAKFLYSKDFYSAWKYVPWLTIAIIFGALSGYLGGFFSAVKKSKLYAQSTVVGAILNIILNLILTPFMGALGAAIATAFSYFAVWVFRYWHSKKFIRMKVKVYRDLITYGLLVVQSVVLLLVASNIWMYSIEAVLFIIIVVLYSKEVMQMINKVLKKIKRRNK